MNTFTRLLILSFCAVQLSCNNADKGPTASPEKKPVIANEGVNIEYTDTGAGDTAIVFIHGWGINQTYWADQVNYFSKRYRVITLDLPGFGRSGKNRKDWSVEAYGKDITIVLNKLDLKHVILVGHSMSGAIVVEAALQNPSKVIGIVGVDNFKTYGMVETPESKKELANAYKMLRSNFKATITGYANRAFFSPSTDSTVRKRVINDITATDSVIAVDCIEQGDKYPLDAKVKTLNKPLYLVNSSATPNDTAAFTKNNITYHLFDIGPTGHYPMIEKPNDFNLLLEQAIRKIHANKQVDH